MIHALFTVNGRDFLSLIPLFGDITKTHPELITAEHLEYIFSAMKTLPNTHNEIIHVFRCLQPVATVRPHLLDKYRDEFLRPITEEQSLYAFLCFQQYLLATAILDGEQTAEKHLTLLIDLLRSIPKISADLAGQIIHTCQFIGIRYKSVLADKRNDFLAFESIPACRTLIDMIDGNKMSEENQATITRTVEEMTQIEQRVRHTERNVENVTKLVKRQELHVSIRKICHCPTVIDVRSVDHYLLLTHCRDWSVNSLGHVLLRSRVPLFQVTLLRIRSL